MVQYPGESYYAPLIYAARMQKVRLGYAGKIFDAHPLRVNSQFQTNNSTILCKSGSPSYPLPISLALEVSTQHTSKPAFSCKSGFEIHRSPPINPTLNY